MAQPVSTQNFLIHDANGKPQVIKVVHTTGSSKIWRASQSPQVRTSTGLVRTVGGPVKQLYNDDDSNSIHMTRESVTPVLSAGKRVVSSRATPTPVKREYTPDFLNDTGYSGKRRRSEKGGKGLRHFSMKVCQKVRQKGKTTYNEVADELVSEFTGCAFQPNMEQNFEQKNIRRRVYDALNVLMAMNIISKEKKEIRWLGLPTGFPKLKSTRDIENEERNARQRIALKKKTLQDLILQQVAFKNLVERNREIEKVRGRPGQTASIQLPMLVVSTNQDTTINCSVSNDRREYFFSFDDVFEIKDESHVLQGMGMMMGLNTGDATPEHLIRAKTMIPRAMAPYLEEMVRENVQGEASSSMVMSDRDYEEDDEGTVYLEEDDSATDDDMEPH